MCNIKIQRTKFSVLYLISFLRQRMKNIVLLLGLIPFFYHMKSRNFFHRNAIINAVHETEVRNEENVRATIDDQISDGNTTVGLLQAVGS